MTLIVDPSTLSPSAWYAADSCTGADASYVATWADGSTSSYDLTQAATSCQPILQTSYRNGHSAVVFDGTDDYMATAVDTSDMLGTGGIGTVLAVISSTGGTTVQGVFGAPAPVTGAGSQVYLKQDRWPRQVVGTIRTTDGEVTAEIQSPLDLHSEASTVTPPLPLYAGQWWHLLCWQHDTGHNVLIGIDRLDTAALVSSTGGPDGEMDNPLTVGMSYLNRYMKGYIAELIVFRTALTEAQRQGVQLYLTNKYAIAYGSNLADEGAAASSPKVELYLPTTSSTGDSTWTDITTDIRAVDGLAFAYGIDGAGPTDRTASAGRATFSLENSAINSVGINGYYSPDSTNARIGWTIGVPARISFDYYGTTYYKWLGQVTDIMPSLDRKHKVVRVNAMDYIDELARVTLNGLEVATSQRADEAFASILDNLPRTPDRYLAGEALDKFPYVFDTARDESVTAISEINKLAVSDFGFAYMKGDVDGGGTLVYEPRGLRETVSRWSMTDSDIDEMEISYSIDDIINRAIVRVHPRRADSTDSTDGPVVLFRLGNKPQINAGESITINCPYRDPNNDNLARVGGYAMLTPTTSSDMYRLWTAISGGTNLTTSCNVVADFGGNSAECTITNNSTQNGYLRLFKLYGYGLYSFEEVIIRSESTASIDSFGAQSESIDMPYHDSIFAATEAADQIVANNKDPRTRCRSVTFGANKSSTRMIQALAREPGDRITITETMSGLNADDYFIQAVEFDVKPGPWTEVTWKLGPAVVETWSSGGWPSR